MVAPFYDKNRKPQTGMFSYVNSLFHYQLNYSNCFYCGDMAGRGCFASIFIE